MEEDAEGRLIWTAEIDAVQEIMPWIRGWGADCEVLEPHEVREQIKGKVRRQARMYGLDIQQHTSNTPNLDLLESLFGE